MKGPLHFIFRDNWMETKWEGHEGYIRSEIVKLFLKGMGCCDVNEKDELGMTPLHYAVQNHNTPLEIIEFLISKGADINSRDKNNRTVLHYVFAYWNPERLQFLVNNGASTLVLDNYNLLPQDYLFESSDIERPMRNSFLKEYSQSKIPFSFTHGMCPIMVTLSGYCALVALTVTQPVIYHNIFHIPTLKDRLPWLSGARGPHLSRSQ